MSDPDTICAVSTPIGEGGIAIVRISGTRALEIAESVFRPKNKGGIEAARSHTLQYGQVTDPRTGEVVDEALVSIMRAPATYTREDVVEINCHGGMLPLWRTVRLLEDAGARQAEPGEFTRRAFLNGRIDLAQAEAVMDIIHAKTEQSLRAANEQLLGGLSRQVGILREKLVGIIAGVEAGIDFPDEDIETSPGTAVVSGLEELIAGIQNMLDEAIYGQVIREGFATAIVGRPNVGKSSLLNALLMQDRAIVTEIPGTTRDVLQEYLNIGGVPLRILDTAGIRHARDVVEREGIRRSVAAMRSADMILLLLDGSMPLTEEDRTVIAEAEGKTTVAVINKSDLPRRLEVPVWPKVQVAVSCKTGGGIEQLRKTILELMQKGAVPPREHAWAVNQRHRLALEQSRQSLENALTAARSALSAEFVSLDMRVALDHLGLIIGATYTDDILERIFQDFCIGK